MKEESLDSLQAKLDEFYSWPALYPFKFIVPLGKVNALTEVFEGKPFTTRLSKTGKYASVSADLEMASSAEVIEVYRRAGKIEGVVAL